MYQPAVSQRCGRQRVLSGCGVVEFGFQLDELGSQVTFIRFPRCGNPRLEFFQQSSCVRFSINAAIFQESCRD